MMAMPITVITAWCETSAPRCDCATWPLDPRRNIVLQTQTISRQTGAALFISLLFLAIMTLLGLSSMQGNTLEERMASNQEDRGRAMQAAELALRVVEEMLKQQATDGQAFRANRFIPCGVAPGVAIPEPNPGPSAVGLWDSSGIRQPGTTNPCVSPAPPPDPTTSSFNWDAPFAQDYSLGLDGDAIPGFIPLSGLSQNPRYYIEALPLSPTTCTSCNSCTCPFRITVRARGATTNVEVILQSTYLLNRGSSGSGPSEIRNNEAPL
jgi:Tfp pilus assembly protein PilX